MNCQTLARCRHCHDFESPQDRAERRTALVLGLTMVTMMVELIAGSLFGSMALLADGWHMATHAAAFGIAIFAYRYARRHAQSAAFSFGTGKVGVLGGFTGAIALAVIALTIFLESGERLLNPLSIRFNEAIGVAVLGLIVNLICALLLQHEHKHDEPGEVKAPGHHHDHNLRAAYVHVLADALTSILAIAALTVGKYSGWHWLDPLTGMVGAAMISIWAWGLIKDTAPILLDGSLGEERLAAISKRLESATDHKVSDLHVWKIGPAAYAALISIVSHQPKESEYYRGLLKDFPEIVHLTLEIHHCQENPCPVH